MPRDRIDQERADREAWERASKHHVGREPSDPAPAWPPPVKEGREGDGNPSIAPTVTRGLWHLSGGIGAASKRIIAMLALWGTVSTFVSTGYAYWFHHAVWEKLDARLAKQEQILRSLELSSKVQETTVGSWSPRIVKLEEKSAAHGEALAALNPHITATTTRRKPPKDPPNDP